MKTKLNLFYPTFIWFITASFYFYEYFLQVSPNVMTHELMQAFHINGTQLGYLGGIYFIAYASMQIPVGLLLDSVGPRRILLGATTIALLGCIVFGLAHTFVHALLARILIGLGSAFAIVSSFKIITNWFPVNKFALYAGLTLTMGMLGAAASQTVVTFLVAHVGWRHCMLLLAAFCGLITFSIFLFVKDKPKDVLRAVQPMMSSSYLWRGLVKVIKNRQTWLLASYGGLMFIPTSVFGGLWGESFLASAYDLDPHQAASLVSFLFFGWMIGSPFFGFISDHVGLRKLPMNVGTIGALIAILCVVYIKLHYWVAAIALFSMGFFSGGFLTCFSIAREINDPETSATALGFMNTLNMIGPSFFQPLVGYILDKTWEGKIVDHVPVYSIHDYHYALAVLPALMFIAILFLPFIKETYCKTTHRLH